jgi:Zn-dependent alcohol dehydrogenase
MEEAPVKTTAAVLFGTGKPFEIMELDLDAGGHP